MGDQKKVRIVFFSDELYPVHDFIRLWLEKQRKEVTLLGSLKSRRSEPSWVNLTIEAVQLVVSGKCDEGILCCWTGTGVSIIANKFKGIRAALCYDAETAYGARVWNHANILCLSNRLVTKSTAYSILNAWFKAYDSQLGLPQVEALKEL